MITKEQALTLDEFHDDGPTNRQGQCRVWRRNGKTQTWKRLPWRFRVPVKYGLYTYAQITDSYNHVHAPTDPACPQRQREEARQR